VTVALMAGVNPVPKTEPEYCRRQAERMHALAEQCPDPKIRDQVEAIAKNWADKAVSRDDWRTLHASIP